MYFVIRRSSNNQYYFVIKSENHEIVATSETYIYKASAELTIDSIKREINYNSDVIDTTV
ncbi:YegP family protein [Apilactobacillus sp. EABW-1NA]|uniref:YegP family protein n=1 Tax=Apilactobacillus sp. EABW-1NA TaxID=2984137 RepID=UPI0025AEFD99|nr:YegP family protein [Apilactobacillus sp. EABW-1NA]MDN2613272.1 YegP family protein [Apilactobacillus sp. EABW-1NA]